MSKKSIQIIITLVTVLIVILSICVYNIFKNKNGDKSYMTAKEFLDLDEFETGKWELGKIYHIKDRVVNITVFKLPGLEGDLQNSYVNISESDMYTSVWFESCPNPYSPIYFIGNRSEDFPKGKEIIFSIPTRKFESDPYNMQFTVECVYVHWMLVLYSLSIMDGEFSIMDVDIEIIDNFSKCIVTIVDILYYYPFPDAYWGDIMVGIWNRTNVSSPVISTIYAYNQNETLIARFDVKNHIKEKTVFTNKIISVGDHIEFDHGDFTSNCSVSFTYKGILFGRIDV